MAFVLQNQFRSRGLMFIQGAHLLVPCLVGEKDFEQRKREFLHTDLNEIQTRYEQAIARIKDYRTGEFHFYDLLKQLIRFAIEELDIPARKAFKTICEAEQFAVWKQGRDDLRTDSVTLGFKVRQLERSSCPLSDTQKQEFLRLQQKDFPVWYKALEPWQQNYLNLQLADTQLENFSQSIRTIPCKLRQVPGLANYSCHTLELRNAANELICESRRFYCAIPTAIDVGDEDEKNRITKQNIEQWLQATLEEGGKKFLSRWNPIIKPGQVLSTPILIQSLLSPLWVDFLAPLFYRHHNESDFLATKNWAVDRIKEKLASHRGVIEIRQGDVLYRLNPVLVATNYPVNFLRQETLLIRNFMGPNSQAGALMVQCVFDFIQDVVLPKFYALSDETQKRIPIQLFETLMREVLVPFIQSESLFLGLIAIPLLNFRLRRIEKILNDCLNAIRASESSAAGKATVISPFKIALNHEQRTCLRILLNALRDYLVLFNTPRKWAYHKEMFLSALEEIIVEKLGGFSCGSSVESRNRKALQTLHVDAMLIYHQQYGALPLYDDSLINRKRFIDIFVDLFFTEHQQKHAGQNAPGSEGFKNIIVLPFVPGMYMIPQDIVQEIRRRDKWAFREYRHWAQLARPHNPYNKWSTSWRHFRALFTNWYR